MKIEDQRQFVLNRRGFIVLVIICVSDISRDVIRPYIFHFP